MKMQLTDSTMISNTMVLTKTEQMATKIITVVFYSSVASDLVDMRPYVIRQGMPTLMMRPHKTRKLQIRFVIDINPNYFHNRPIVDLAPSI